ncbi:23S rRNA (adenine(2503)-C(2))-methyltransferase RlmN [Clostridium ihumii]|uniref:23S rRNA (adenine(2503)-C(2))-methyltransferase RlmN n=1 Tax=Clostridium ihumii TaxID=1470356 RepID=UPI00059113E7|nr:23S rRNA (adenine(2503)-C(2))-methyltransferase RlmN [Clostridium ihumii]
MKNILDLNLNELKVWMKENGESEFRAKQVFTWLYKNTYDFDNMKNISKSTISKLKNNFSIELPKILETYKSIDGNTRKHLLKLKDNNLIETVVMQYHHGNSICVSTQVGCRMGCKFCASTLDGVVRNLTAGEILGQIIIAQEELGERISNIVLMGSGEPLDNYDNVLKFLELVNAEYGLNIGQRHITLSTCGIVPKIKDLADKNLQITLAISLHAPNDNVRKQTMPIAKAYNFENLFEACNYYVLKTNRRITFEYALVRGFNDSEEDAMELSKVLKGMLCHVNLIPINEIKESTLKRANLEDINKFKNILSKNGIETTIRKEMGLDINAACGQLRRSYLEKKEL